MQPTPAIDVVIARLVRCINDKIAAGGQPHVREFPLGGGIGAVREIPADQIDRHIAEIMEFNPVGRLAITIIMSRLVTGHELADHQRLRSGRSPERMTEPKEDNGHHDRLHRGMKHGDETSEPHHHSRRT